MALRVPKASGPQLFREGYRIMQGVEDAVIRNCNAIRELSEIVRTYNLLSKFHSFTDTFRPVPLWVQMEKIKLVC